VRGGGGSAAGWVAGEGGWAGVRAGEQSPMGTMVGDGGQKHSTVNQSRTSRHMHSDTLYVVPLELAGSIATYVCNVLQLTTHM
jgi:hypothetical protein